MDEKRIISVYPTEYEWIISHREHKEKKGKSSRTVENTCDVVKRVIESYKLVKGGE